MIVLIDLIIAFPSTLPFGHVIIRQMSLVNVQACADKGNISVMSDTLNAIQAKTFVFDNSLKYYVNTCIHSSTLALGQRLLISVCGFYLHINFGHIMPVLNSF